MLEELRVAEEALRLQNEELATATGRNGAKTWSKESPVGGNAHQAKPLSKERVSELPWSRLGRSSFMSPDSFNSVSGSGTAGDRHVCPGIVVVSTSMRMLHANRQAIKLLKQIRQTALDGQHRNPSPPLLSAVLTEFCAEMVNALKVRMEAKDSNQLEVKGVVSHPHHPVRIRGFGLPAPMGIQQSRLVLILEQDDDRPIAHREPM